MISAENKNFMPHDVALREDADENPPHSRSARERIAPSKSGGAAGTPMFGT